MKSWTGGWLTTFFFFKISPLTGGKPALPGNGREAG